MMPKPQGLRPSQRRPSSGLAGPTLRRPGAPGEPQRGCSGQRMQQMGPEERVPAVVLEPLIVGPTGTSWGGATSACLHGRGTETMMSWPGTSESSGMPAICPPWRCRPGHRSRSNSSPPWSRSGSLNRSGPRGGARGASLQVGPRLMNHLCPKQPISADGAAWMAAVMKRRRQRPVLPAPPPQQIVGCQGQAVVLEQTAPPLLPAPACLPGSCSSRRQGPPAHRPARPHMSRRVLPTPGPRRLSAKSLRPPPRLRPCPVHTTLPSSAPSTRCSASATPCSAT